MSVVNTISHQASQLVKSSKLTIVKLIEDEVPESLAIFAAHRQ